MSRTYDFDDVKDGFQKSLNRIDELVGELKEFENEHFKSDVTIMSYNMLIFSITNATLDDRQRFSVAQIKELKQMRKDKIKEVFEKEDE